MVEGDAAAIYRAGHVAKTTPSLVNGDLADVRNISAVCGLNRLCEYTCTCRCTVRYLYSVNSLLKRIQPHHGPVIASQGKHWA